MGSATHKNRATATGFLAILTWSSLALLTYYVGDVPPFQLVAMSFSVASLLGLLSLIVQGIDPRLKKLSFRALLLGVGGLFGYHFFFFLALRHAPALEASLINYLWPLLIVLFSALLPAVHQEGRLQWWHLLGAGLGFGGAVLILISSNQTVGAEVLSSNWFGYGAALVAALIWSSYSVITRLFAALPTQAVTIYCVITAIGALIAHRAFEVTSWPQTELAWLAFLLLGLGPVGGSFYLWDRGMKGGNVRLLGVLAYLAPLFSTLLLAVFGIGSSDPRIWLAACLILGGAGIAAGDIILKSIGLISGRQASK